MTHTHKLAVFDLDHTLLPIDSDYTWTTFTNLMGWTNPEEAQATNNFFYEQYCKRQLDMHDYVKFVVSTLIGEPATRLAEIQKQYIDTCITQYIVQPALDLLHTHRQAQDTLLLTTATNCFIANPIGIKMGFEANHILATQLEYDNNGSITGAIVGEPNLGAGKLHNLEQWLAQRNLQWGDVHITFYSDSINDVPLLEQAQVPVATNPDDALRKLATQRNWRIVDLFSKQ